MKQYFSASKTLMTVIALLLAFTFASKGIAQNNTASVMQSVSIITVKPGMDLEWENFLKKDLLPILKKSGLKQMRVTKSNVFSKGTVYMFFLPIEDMAMFDGPDPIASAAGPDGLALVRSNMQRMVAGTHTFLLTSMIDLTIPPKQGYELKMGVMAKISVAPGRRDDYIKRTKELVSALGKSNAKAVLTGSISLGGNPNDFIMLVAFDSFADLGQFPQFMEQLTPEAGITTHIECTVLKMTPELGIEPARQ